MSTSSKISLSPLCGCPKKSVVLVILIIIALNQTKLIRSSKSSPQPSISLVKYFAQKDDVHQRLLYGRTSTERETREEELGRVLRALGDRLSDHSSVVVRRDATMRELEELAAGLA